jgi:phosphoserine phosphatase RsbU/P
MHTTGTGMSRDDRPSTGVVLRLVVIKGKESRTVVLDRFPFNIGRRSDRDLVIDDVRISREHVRLEREPEGVYLVKQSKKYGTFVNGERVDRCKLEANDRIEFGIPDGPQLVFSSDRSSSEVRQLLSQWSTRKQTTR